MSRNVPQSSTVSARKGTRRRRLAYALVGAWLLDAGTVAARAVDFTPPTKEELEMKSVDGYPGAPAVVLFREAITRDDLHVVQHYDRIKILTEEGKKYANVELEYFSSHSMGYFEDGDDKTADSIQGRTIHADGTIIPFTGKPYLKVLQDAKAYKIQEKIFTLPDVEVGSIIEYRYATRINDNTFESPDWLLQGDLLVKKAHYAWYPTKKPLVDSETGNPINAISWFPILRKEDKLETRERPDVGQFYELTATDIPPVPKEEFMPPIRNFTLRVMFSFTQYRTANDFWNSEGKRWSKRVNAFAGPNGDLRAATQKIIAGATTDEDKVKKIYAAVMQLENTEYTREHEQREDKANGVGKTNNAADVLAHRRGSPTQIAELFLGMVRAAGLPAYAVLVPDRSIEFVTKRWLNLSQFDDVIVLVKIDGKDRFFDPGARYEPYGRLAWQHTAIPDVLRQTDGGIDWTFTPGEAYTANERHRVANLKLDPSGQVTGSIDLTYLGAPAVHWRQTALRGDSESLKKQLEESAQSMVPKTLELKLESITDLDDYDKPLVVKFKATGTMGTATGKRVMIPADLFVAGDSATFPHEKRELAVYFHYPEVVRDALRINLPPNLTPEAVPDKGSFGMPGTAAYQLTVESAPDHFVSRRSFACNTVVVAVPDYPKLRTFYTQFEAKDQESVVLKQVTTQASAESAAARTNP